MRRRSASPAKPASIAASCRSGRRKAIVFADGDLALVDRQRRTAQAMSDPNERMRWHGMLTHIADERGYKPGWAAHKFKEKFGTWPARAQRQRRSSRRRKCCHGFASRVIAYAKAKDGGSMKPRDKGPAAAIRAAAQRHNEARCLARAVAWRQVALCALKGSYNTKLQGGVYLSTRDAAKELGSHSHRDIVRRWFRELQYYGFIVMVSAGSPWRRRPRQSTALAADRDATLPNRRHATFERWDGDAVSRRKARSTTPQKTESRTTRPAHRGPPVRSRPGPPVRSSHPPSGPPVQAIQPQPPGPPAQAITSLTTPSLGEPATGGSVAAVAADGLSP